MFKTILYMVSVSEGDTIEHLEHGSLRVFKIDDDGDMLRLWTYHADGSVVRVSRAPFDHVVVHHR